MRQGSIRARTVKTWKGVLAGAGLWMLCAAGAWAQNIPGFNPTANQTSLTRQFVVHGAGNAPGALQEIPVPKGPNGQNLALWLARVPSASRGDVITLDPRLAAVSAERIKTTILRMFRQPDQWRGQIHVYLASPRKWKGSTEIRPVSFGDGWRYAIIVPEDIEWQRFVRTVAGAVLLEMVNRKNPDRFAEPPLWLTEGISELLIVDPGRALVIEADRTFQTASRRADLTAEARRLLGKQGVLDWNELSNANAASFRDEEAYGRFRGSAVLLTDLLLLQASGAEKLGQFTATLGDVLNWQTAFLKAYQADFSSLLDVEKWWAVADAANAINGSSGLWTKEIVMAHLSEIYTETVTAESGQEVTGRRTITLPQLILTLDFKSQQEILERKLDQLRLLLAHSDRTLAPLVEETFLVLNQYSEDRSKAGRDPIGRSELEARGKLLGRAAARRLSAISQKVTNSR